MNHFHDLLKEYINITISTNGVEYNDDDDPKDNDAIPTLLVFEPQEFVRLPSNTIAIFGLNDKENAGCCQDISISATCRQSECTIILEGQATVSSDHNFNTEHLIPSLTHCVNIKSDTGNSPYRGGNEGGGCMFVSIQYDAFTHQLV